MNTNKLKKFAQETRKKLLKQINGKLEYVLSNETGELREKEPILNELRKELDRFGREALVDKVAYTWFNRLVALRYMDVRGFQPLKVSILSPIEGQISPQILQETMAGHIPEELKVDRQKVMDLLDGRIQSSNAENEAYRLLLIASCNHLHSIFPFLFEAIDDYTELLLPDDLTSEFSIIHDVIDGMTAEDCQQVEILGWLYQFYISEKKDEVFASKGKVKKEEIPAATQLFTPRWIVEYMVQNTVGKLWVLNHPNSGLKEHMEYYIESEVTAEDVLTIDKPEELTLLDQACGSGHILVYGFELLYKIYEEEGYAPSDIPRLIIEHNLHGFEIDERAAQLAGLAILMKAREHQRRLFRKSNVPVPNITCFEDLTLTDKEIKETLSYAGVEVTDELLHDLQNMQQATNFGSLIVPHVSVQEIQKAKKACEQAMEKTDLFEKEKLEQMVVALDILEKLETKVSCVVDNPPYMGSGKMNKELSKFVKANYSDSKSDLMACFMECGLQGLEEKGLLGMINQHNWMFLSGYENLREIIINKSFIDTLLHLGPRTFPEITGEVVQNASFTILKHQLNVKGVFFRLVNYSSSDKKKLKTCEAIQNSNCSWKYFGRQEDFKKIPGKPLGYWLSNSWIKSFDNFEKLGALSDIKAGMATGNNEKFVRYWHEVSKKLSIFEAENKEVVWDNKKKWVVFNKGGGLRKWYGNKTHIISFDKQSYSELKQSGNKCPSESFYFKECLTWSDVTSGPFGIRFLGKGSVFSTVGNSIFKNGVSLKYLCCSLIAKTADDYLKIINPTLHANPGEVAKIPIPINNQIDTDGFFDKGVRISKSDWDSRETSWDFQQNELIRFNKEGGIETLEEAYDHYKQYWQNKFYQLHQNEEELNQQFIEIYGLQEELTPDVPLDEITILQEELDRKKLKVISDRWLVNRDQAPGTNHQPPNLPFKDKEVMVQFVSYTVGCMFGRYSLEKPGLILANQGETLEDYVRIVTGDWWFVNSKGKWEIDKNKNAYEYYTQLQRSGDLAGGHSPDQTDLPVNGNDAKGRGLRADESDQTSSSEYTQQHSRGTDERDQRVQTFSEDSSGISGRTGHPTDIGGRIENAAEGADTKYFGRSGDSGKTNQQSDKQAQISHYSQIAKHQSPVTDHQSTNPPITFYPDDDNIIPVLDDEWFEDDIVTRFYEFIKVSFGADNFQKNLSYLEGILGKDMRRYFSTDFYKDHYKRYNKRPIYWKFTSPKGYFSVLIYMHRYTQDTLNNILNNYLREFIEKLKTQKEQMQHLENTGSAGEKTRALKEIDKLNAMIKDCEEYQREILYPLASERIKIDLDDGVLVNYNLFGNAVEEIKGVNDPKKKKKVKEFDWIDGGRIR